MLCLIWWFMLYIPIIHAVNVRVDGSIDFDHNWSYKFPSFAEILRMANSSTTPVNSYIRSKTNEHPDSLSYIKGYSINGSAESSPNMRGRSSRNNPLSNLLRPLKNIYMALIDDRTSAIKKPNDAVNGGIQAFVLDSFPELNTMLPPVVSKPAFKSHQKNITGKAKPVEMRYKLITKKRRRKRNKLATRKILPRKRQTRSIVTTTHDKITEATTKITIITRGRMSKYYLKFNNKNKKRYKKFGTRKRETSTTAATTVGETIELKIRTKDIQRGRTSKFFPKITVIQNQQALYTGEPHKKKTNLRQNAETNDNLVKNNEKAQMFTINVFNQNIGVFNSVRSKIKNTYLKDKIDVLSKIYRDKFANFVESNQNQKIVTRLGTQKVVLNTIETSNRIMRRILNLFIAGMEKVLITDKDGVIGLWSNQLENEEKQEYTQACQFLKICRSKYSFSSFLAEVVAILLRVSNQKLKQAADAFAEVLIELSHLLDISMKTQFLKNIEAIERSEPEKIRILLTMFRNMLVNKNKPLVVRESVLISVINQTVSLMDAIDLLDAKLLASDENVSRWNYFKNSLTQWANGHGGDILEIMQSSVNMVVESIRKMNKEMARILHAKFQMFLLSTSTTYEFYK